MAGPLTVPRLPPHDPGTPALSVVDMHTGGEPLRIVLAGCPEVVGPTLLAKRRYMRQHLDYVRRRLMFEPRGHRDMYGAVLVPSELPDAHLGVLFLNNEGYSSMCATRCWRWAASRSTTGWCRRPRPTSERPWSTSTARAGWWPPSWSARAAAVAARCVSTVSRPLCWPQVTGGTLWALQSRTQLITLTVSVGWSPRAQLTHPASVYNQSEGNSKSLQVDVSILAL